MNSDEERLRTALHHHAAHVEPRAESRERIQERVDDARRRRRRGWAAGTTGAVAAAVLLVVALASLGGGGGQVVETGPAAPSSPTVAPDPPPPPDGRPPAPERGAPTIVPGIWPLHTVADLEAYRDSGDTRYEDPADVARAFAVEYLGMMNPVVGQPVDGEAGTVEVVVRPRGESARPVPAGAMDTIVVLGPLGGDGQDPAGPWNVRAAMSKNIRLDGDQLVNGAASPLAVSGEATAYEGTVQVEVRQAGMEAGEALGRGVVTAGALGNFGPFATEIPFDPPTTAGSGALVLYTESAVDGSTQEATVVGLSFGSGSPTLPTATTPAGQSEITVYFHRGEELVAVTRSVPATTGVLRASLEALLAGPTDEERADGLSSWFSPATAGLLEGVSMAADGAAVVDLGDLRPVIPNASTSAGSERLLGELNATTFQFPTVRSVEYRLEGSCSAFFEWLQRSCEVVKRPSGG